MVRVDISNSRYETSQDKQQRSFSQSIIGFESRVTLEDPGQSMRRTNRLSLDVPIAGTGNDGYKLRGEGSSDLIGYRTESVSDDSGQETSELNIKIS